MSPQWDMVGALGLVLAAASSCSTTASEPPYQTGLEELELLAIEPGVALPGTTLVVRGESFIGAPFATSELFLTGEVSPTGDGDMGEAPKAVNLRVPARFIDFEHLEVDLDPRLWDALGGRPGSLRGTAQVAFQSEVDHQLHLSQELPIELDLALELAPVLEHITDTPVIFVNEPIEVDGRNLLLGGDEGTTYAHLRGCFQNTGGTDCISVPPRSLPMVPASRFDRAHGSFPFAPEITGIEAGTFEGEVILRNVYPSGAVRESAPVAVTYDLTTTGVLDVRQDSATLGQFVEVEGGGFVGGAPGQHTLLHLVGEYQSDNEGDTGDGAIAIDTVLVPTFVSGRVVRYVMTEDDDLGRSLELRDGAGLLVGTLAPIATFGDQEVKGAPREFSLRLGPVRQVVYLHFAPQYVTSLQHFGLRAVDHAIRQRVFEVVRRDYHTINIEFRTEPVTDYSHYSEVEIGGPDPNGLGLLGYDNTPGKDVGNQRLYDRIGGVSSQSQLDGFPGFGGVFVESLFSYSEHPAGLAAPSPGRTPDFDLLFDPFRADRDGTPVTQEEASEALPTVTGADCPASERPQQIACAVWTLGSLVGSTVSHEIAHSLGLANPTGTDVHLSGDRPNRLMEAGSQRPFRERAELGTDGPGVFCDAEYLYLRAILPTAEPADPRLRPDCDET